jgi:hypothetical protein
LHAGANQGRDAKMDKVVFFEERDAAGILDSPGGWHYLGGY